MVVIAADGKETEEIGFDGSAPLRVRFESRAADYGSRTPLYEWQFRRDGNTTPFLTRYDANTSYDSPRAARSWCSWLISFVEGTDTVTYTQSEAFRIAISESKLEFPNAFTPNGDGINDVFKAKEGYKSIVRFRALVCNRWGRKVHEWHDPADGWDGRIGSAERPTGLLPQCRGTRCRRPQLPHQENHQSPAPVRRKPFRQCALIRRQHDRTRQNFQTR